MTLPTPTTTTETGGLIVNAGDANQQHLTGGMDFYTIYTLNAMNNDNWAAVTAGQNTVRFNEIVGLQAQPVILSITAISGVDLNANSQANAVKYGLGTSIDGSSNSNLTNATIYQVKFTFEHPGAWLTSDFTATVAGTLAYALKNETTLASLPYVTTLYGSTGIDTFVFSGTNNSGTTGSGTGTTQNTSITWGNLF